MEHDDNSDTERYGERSYRNKEDIRGGSKDIRPDMPGNESRAKSAEKPSGTAASVDSMKAAERNAGAPVNPISDKSAAGSASEAETAIASHANNVKGKGGGGEIPLSKSALTKKMMKKFGPVGLIMGLVAAGALAIFGAQSFLPFHLLEMLTEKYDSLQVGTNVRGRTLLKNMLSDETDPIKSKLIPFTGNKYKKMSKDRLKRLADEGLTFANKGSFASMADADGILNLKRVDGSPIDDLTDANGKFKERVLIFDDGSGTGTVVSANNDEFYKLFDSNADFRNGYLKGSRTWSGRIAGWFDSVVTSFLKKKGIGRDLFEGWIKQTEEIDAGNAARRAALEETLRKGVGQEGEMTTRAGTQEDDDPDTKDTNEAKLLNEDESKRATAADTQGKVENLRKKATDIAEGIANKLSVATMTVCLAALTMMAVSALVAAAELFQVVQYAAAFAETVNKTQTGGDAPIHEYSNMLTEVAPSHDGTTQKTAMESSSVMWATTGSAANQSGASETTFSLEGASMLQTIGSYSKETMLGCAIANGVLAAVSLAISAVPVAGQIYAGAKAVVKFVIKVVKVVAMPFVISKVVDLVTNILTPILTRNLVSGIFGEDVGNAIAAGMHGYQFGNHQAGGGSAGTEKAVLAFQRQQREVTAMQAELDRATHSPFDIGNKNTFFGSILSKTLPYAGKSVGVFSVLRTFGGIAATSMPSLLPTASALSDVDFKSNFGDCPELESIGAVGDIFCQPYYVSDVTTKGLSPEDTFRKVYASDWSATPRGGQSFTWGPKPSEGRSYKNGRTVVSGSQGDDVDFAGEHWAWAGIAGIGKRQHNFYLETDYCDNRYRGSSAAHHTSYTAPDGVTYYTITPYGQCLDRAAYNGEDNVMLDKWTGDVSTDPTDYEKNGGKESIVVGSNLDTYIQFCANRETNLGRVDSGIVDALKIIPQGALSTVAQSLLSLVPIAGDIADIVAAADDVKATLDPWSDGRNCVAGDGSVTVTSADENGVRTTSTVEHPHWNKELVYYQQYIEDTRILEAQGAYGSDEDSPAVGTFTPEDDADYPSPIFAKDVFGSSPIGDLLAKYEEFQPTDYSYEGRLAAMSGLDKETVVAFLDLFDDYKNGKFNPEYIASLHPAPYGCGSEERHGIEELNSQKTVLAKALKRFDGAKVFSMMSFGENRRKWVTDLV
jgi:hypothetical protein